MYWQGEVERPHMCARMCVGSAGIRQTASRMSYFLLFLQLINVIKAAFFQAWLGLDHRLLSYPVAKLSSILIEMSTECGMVIERSNPFKSHP